MRSLSMTFGNGELVQMKTIFNEDSSLRISIWESTCRQTLQAKKLWFDIYSNSIRIDFLLAEQCRVLQTASCICNLPDWKTRRRTIKISSALPFKNVFCKEFEKNSVKTLERRRNEFWIEILISRVLLWGLSWVDKAVGKKMFWKDNLQAADRVQPLSALVERFNWWMMQLESTESWSWRNEERRNNKISNVQIYFLSARRRVSSRRLEHLRTSKRVLKW